MTDIIIAGVGGQGTVLASKIICNCAVLKGRYVVSSETIGMAQRGGVVLSHIRISEEYIECSPLIKHGGADILIAFEPSEAVRALPYLKKDGVVITATEPVFPIIQYDYRKDELIDFIRKNSKICKFVDTYKVCSECNSFKVLNVVLLGAVNEYLHLDNIEEVIKNIVKPSFVDINLKAFKGGKSL